MSHTESPNAEPETPTLQRHGPSGPNTFFMLALGSVGVVYGDIGTSPIYALREAIKAAMGGNGTLTEPLVFGILSLIIWALILVVTIKYVVIILNADNRGEGGILSLTALAQRGRGKYFITIPILGMMGAALFCGDAMITPAISVLSAIEGLSIITPTFDPYILPITLVIIIALFAAQSYGTARVAQLFGPITATWFIVLAISGAVHIVANPTIMQSVNPVYGLRFLSEHGTIGLLTAGAVFLAVTGGEALYADLGHFGKNPIRYAWLFFVLPCLLINYLGQGALILRDPKLLDNPFFLMMPAWALLPTVILATAATIIASQAVITGAYSMTRQAIQLGLMPRMQVKFTSAETSGQIYMPQVNAILLVGVILLVLSYKSSSNLAAAYGIAVSGTMVVTTLLAIVVVRTRWKWSGHFTALVMVPLLAIDVAFVAVNSLKIADGGWVPLLIGAAVFTMMWTWRLGQLQLKLSSEKAALPLDGLLKSLENSSAHHVKGTAVYFTSDRGNTPNALLHSMKHFQVLHGANVILNLRVEDVPYVEKSKQLVFKPLAKGFWSANASLGYLDATDIPQLLKQETPDGLSFDDTRTTYFLSRRNLLRTGKSQLKRWQSFLFMLLSRNADDASSYFNLPPDRVVEIGSRQEL
jgi:KUP system potassium uptake protein